MRGAAGGRARTGDVAVLVLAAGKGTRMRSNLVKVLHPLAGRPMLAYVLDLASSLRPQRLAVVIGHQADAVKKAFEKESSRLVWVLQREQKGTADAVIAARGALQGFVGTLVILYGDVPLLRRTTVRGLLRAHRKATVPVTVLTATVSDPTGYGRIVRGPDGGLIRIVEEADASPAERSIREINTGIYCMEAPFLFEALATVDAENAQGEYYLTDVIATCVKRGGRVGSYETEEPERALGINTRRDLAVAEAVIRAEICDRWMLSGVTIVDPRGTYIDQGVRIGRDTRIGPNCRLYGATVVGASCHIGPGCVLTDAVLGERVTLGALCVLERVTIENGARVEPLSYLCPTPPGRQPCATGHTRNRLSAASPTAASMPTPHGCSGRQIKQRRR